MSDPQQPAGQGSRPGRHGDEPWTDRGGQPPHGRPDRYTGTAHGGPTARNLTVAIAVVLGATIQLITFGFGAYAVLGQFRGDDPTVPAAGTSASGGDGAFLQNVIQSATDKDAAGMKALTCPEPGRNLQRAMDYVGTTDRWKVTGSKLVVKDKLDASVTISFKGAGTNEVHLIAIKDDGDWCWQDIVTSNSPRPTPTQQPGIGRGVDFTERVLETLNDGDAPRVKRLLCPDSTSQADVDEIVRGTAKLQIDPNEVGDTGDYIGIDLKGTLNGEPIAAGRISCFLEDHGWCVHTIYAIP